jgi:AraC-like DNA-binding protein
MEPMYIDKSQRKYYSFPVHQHDFWEVTINLSGSGTATVDGQEYPFQVGTIFCLAPGIAHGKVSGDGFVDGSLMLRHFVPFGSSDVYHLEDDANGSIQYLFNLMFDVMMKDGPNAQAIIHSLADAMYQMMIGWSLVGNRSPVVERFQKILLDNLSNFDFDISDVLKKSGYCSSYFRKLFKRSTGHSPLGYLNHMRIEYAKRQIQQYYGFRSMKEIALHSGFTDPYYFSRVFHQYAGISPTMYGEEMSKVRVQKIDWEHPAKSAAI